MRSQDPGGNTVPVALGGGEKEMPDARWRAGLRRTQRAAQRQLQTWPLHLQEKGLQSRIHRRAARNRPLSERQASANTTRSRVRARVEHVFGHQQSSMGGKIVRTIGIARARFKIGNNIRRLVQLERMAAAPA
jgi:hypothetical protein